MLASVRVTIVLMLLLVLIIITLLFSLRVNLRGNQESIEKKCQLWALDSKEERDITTLILIQRWGHS